MVGANRLILIILFFFLTLSSVQAHELDSNIIIRLENHISYLSSNQLMGRPSGSKYSNMAFEYIKSEFQSIGLETHNQYLFNNPRYKNIIGIIPGSDSQLKNEWIIISAHYDHIGYQTHGDMTYNYWDSTGRLKKVRIIDNSLEVPENDTIVYNGADDNASGVGLMLELARKIKENKANLCRSIAFIGFDANETGRNGSIYFANNALSNIIEKKNIRLVINLDMVGHLNKDSLLYIYGIDDLREPDINKIENIGGNKIEYREGFGGYDYQFDNISFEKEDIPSILFTTGIKHYNRKTWDNAKFIDYYGIALIKDNIYDLLLEIDKSKRITKKEKKNYFRKGPDNNSYFGFNLGFGTNEHYYKEGTMTSKPSNGGAIGLFYRYSLNNFFVLKPELAYEYKRANRVNGSIDYHSISLPLSLISRYATLNNSFELSLGAGVYYSYNIGSKYNLGNENINKFINPNTFGLQYSLEFRVLRYIIGYQAKYGFYNIIQSPMGATRPIDKFLKLGYVF